MPFRYRGGGSAGPHPGGAEESGHGGSPSPHPGGKLRGLAGGSPGPHMGVSPGPHRGGGLCIAACTEADPPGLLLPRTVRILLECILVKVI